MSPPSLNHPTGGTNTPHPALWADLPLKGGGIVLGLMTALLAFSANAAPSAAELAQAGNLFAITCSSSFCHGEAGVGGRGPSLQNRNLTPDFIRGTIVNGRSGTPMPSFKDSLSQPELNLIVSYVMSLSPNNHGGDAGAAAPAPASAPPAAPLSAQAEAGRAIFFDLARPGSCAACHSYKEQGGPIGPDLNAIAGKTPQDLYQAMMKPKPLTDGYPTVKISLKNGEIISGIRKGDAQKESIQIYDLSSTPPVLRTFYKSDGWREFYPESALPYTHDLTGYSKDEVASLIAFLKSASGPAKDVTPQDFAQP